MRPDQKPGRSPTNITHGTLHFIGEFDSAGACFAAVNASKAGPFHSFTYNDDSKINKPGCADLERPWTTAFSMDVFHFPWTTTVFSCRPLFFARKQS